MNNVVNIQDVNEVNADSMHENITAQTLGAQVVEEDTTMQTDKVQEDVEALEQDKESSKEAQSEIKESTEIQPQVTKEEEQIIEENKEEQKEISQEKDKTHQQTAEEIKKGQEKVLEEKKKTQEQAEEEKGEVSEQKSEEIIKEEMISTIVVSEKVETNNKNNFISFVGILLFVLVIILGISQFVMRRKKVLTNRKNVNSKNKNKMENIVVDNKNVSSGKGDEILTVKPIVIQNIGQRESQQDSFSFSNFSNPSLVQEKGVMAIVADGMGGLKNGAEVSGIVAYVFKDYFDNNYRNEDVTMSYLNMLQEANSQVKDYVANTGGSMSGSTVVSVIIKEGKMNFISVGDSRIYLLRNSKLIQLNREHIYAYELDYNASVGRISVGDAYRDPQRNSLTSYIGQEQIEQIDYNREPLEVAAGDKVLLMSDGVFGTLTNTEIVDAVDGFSLEKGAENLEIAVLQKQKKMQDNFTAVILEIQ